MTSRPMFPPVFDSTMLSAGASCPHKMFRTYIEHWKPQHESVHLVAGGAFAKGIEVARKAFYERVAIQPEIGADGHVTWHESSVSEAVPPDTAYALGAGALIAAYGAFDPPEYGSGSAKTLDRMLGALEFYFENYPFGEDGMEPIRFSNGRTGIEFSFATPLPVTHPVSGDPILFAGRADLIAEFAGGTFIVDEKTTSSLGPSWSKQWDMRGQFSGYQWAAGEMGVRASGSIVRGVSILKTKYETQQAITYRAPWELDRWLDITVENINRYIQMWKNTRWPQDVSGGACAEYGGCSLMRICKQAPENAESFLSMYFEPRVWSPLERKEMTVAEYETAWSPCV